MIYMIIVNLWKLALTLVHESGPSQIEINLNHGDPLALADQAFMFKRAVRQVAF